ncbi:uncharacterized protein LOC109822683 [Asparagus officinalis]|uniref:uncharacterized protein LOC109822683 n=1 Tax=Asparagus officinalis TaxID=4686 RepID=UPI00098E7E50|nr:uncharacterized protein LOC109822683 [Asparagus officinalis]XP_020244505.1 uncharacterized protein LOC109822683 [Asparagus officinalis]
METRFNQKRAESDSCPFRKFIRRHISKDDAYSSKESSLEASVASASGNNGDHSMIQEEFVSDESALLSLHPWIFKKESYQEGTNNGVEKSRGSLRSRRFRRFLVKPVTFTGNYMKPFAEQVEMDEYCIDSPPNSPTPSLRPFVVTDERKIISKSSFDYFSMRHENPLLKEDDLHKEADMINSVAKRAVTGAPLLPNSGKMKRKSSELQDGSVEASNSMNPCKILQLEDLIYLRLSR